MLAPTLTIIILRNLQGFSSINIPIIIVVLAKIIVVLAKILVLISIISIISMVIYVLYNLYKLGWKKYTSIIIYTYLFINYICSSFLGLGMLIVALFSIPTIILFCRNMKPSKTTIDEKIRIFFFNLSSRLIYFRKNKHILLRTVVCLIVVYFFMMFFKIWLYHILGIEYTYILVYLFVIFSLIIPTQIISRIFYNIVRECFDNGLSVSLFKQIMNKENYRLDNITPQYTILFISGIIISFVFFDYITMVHSPSSVRLDNWKSTVKFTICCPSEDNIDPRLLAITDSHITPIQIDYNAINNWYRFFNSTTVEYSVSNIGFPCNVRIPPEFLHRKEHYISDEDLFYRCTRKFYGSNPTEYVRGAVQFPPNHHPVPIWDSLDDFAKQAIKLYYMNQMEVAISHITYHKEDLINRIRDYENKIDMAPLSVDFTELFPEEVDKLRKGAFLLQEWIEYEKGLLKDLDNTTYSWLTVNVPRPYDRTVVEKVRSLVYTFDTDWGRN